MVACQLPKLNARVRFPLPAPTLASAEICRVLQALKKEDEILPGVPARSTENHPKPRLLSPFFSWVRRKSVCCWSKADKRDEHPVLAQSWRWKHGSFRSGRSQGKGDRQGLHSPTSTAFRSRFPRRAASHDISATVGLIGRSACRSARPRKWKHDSPHSSSPPLPQSHMAGDGSKRSETVRWKVRGLRPRHTFGSL